MSALGDARCVAFTRRARRLRRGLLGGRVAGVHASEAEAARAAYEALDAEARSQLLAFLQAL